MVFLCSVSILTYLSKISEFVLGPGLHPQLPHRLSCIYSRPCAMKNSWLYTMGSPNSLDCILRQASPGVGNPRLFSLLVAWSSAPEAAVSWGFFSHHCSCCFPVGMSPGASLDLPGCGSCCSPGDTSPGASLDIPSGWSF